MEAEGAILCFIIYLIPGLPKDIICYLFGISPMPLWLFALLSGLGRMPGTWVLSAQGAHVETGHYLELVVVSAIFAAIALPLYYYRNRMVGWVRRRSLRDESASLQKRVVSTEHLTDTLSTYDGSPEREPRRRIDRRLR